MSEPVAYTVKQAATAANVPEQQLWAAITGQKLRAHMAGPHVVITRVELERFVATLPGPLDGYDSESARREAKLKQDTAARERGRQIALKAMGKAPASPPKSAAERERAHQERVASEQAARQRGRDLVAKIRGK